MKLRNLTDFFNELKIPIAISIFFLLFKGTIEDFLETVLVRPFISKLEISVFSDMIFLILVIVIIHFVIIKLKKNYFVSFKILFSSLIITAFYIYYRIDNNICEFYGLSFLESVKLLDIIPLFTLGLLLIKIFHSYKIKKNASNNGFFLDSPLGKNGNDLLKRENLAIHIASQIKKTSSPESSFAIGISSEWGFGKTSFLDLIERSLDDKTNVIIKINPWVNHDSKNIIKDFFNTLNSELAKYNSEISPLLKKYAKILIGASNNNFLNTIVDENTTVSNEFKEIDSAIKRINKKIIIFIDDLDRLYENEIAQVVKLIRNSANFSNTFFIVAYDRNYIVNAIKLINNYTPELFLEKIFQLEILLPNFENHIIKNRIFELLKSRVTEEDRNELTSILIKKTRKPFVSNPFNSSALTTLRDATRFANSFLIAYNYLKGESVLADLLNLEVLRLKYPSIYKLIFFQTDDFLITKPATGDRTVYSLREEGDSDMVSVYDNDDKNSELVIKSYIEKNFGKLGISESDIDKVIHLLYSLFPDTSNIFYRDESKLLSVSNPSSFDRYSHYRLLDTNVSEIEFSKYRLKSLGEFCSKIEEWINNGLRWELKTRFEEIKDFSSRSDFENIIGAIFHLARFPKIDSIDNDYNGFDFNNLYSKLSNVKKYLELNYFDTEEEYIDFILSIFEKAPSPFTFEIDFIYQLFDTYSITYEFIVPKEKLDALRLKYFKTYLDQASEMDYNVWYLYHRNDEINIINQSGNTFTREKVKKPEATELLKDFIRSKALDSFLVDIIELDHYNRKEYAVSDIIPKMFGSFDEFGKFLNDFPEDDYSYLKEFKEFFAKFKENEFKVYVDFNFKTIPVKKR